MIGLHLRTVALPLLLPLVAACRADATTEPGAPQFRLEEVATGLSSPVYLTAPPGDTSRVFVVEQGGRIRVLKDGTLLAAPFLDLSGQLRAGNEQGLLGLAFHPQYATNGRFIAHYTDRSGDTRVVEYRRGASPEVAEPTPVATILAVDQPYSNHNGGQILFGPDGYLYIGLGDGGSGGDPHGHGQNRGTLLGAILRLDVDGPRPYRIPPDNPFVGEAGARGEVWAYGLRNPWRFGFDRETGDLYIADVGQNAWEEIDVAPAGSGAGRNYGWNTMEGAHCYGAAGCDQSGLVRPIHEYSHADGCSVTGGYVYRGRRIPSLRGLYFFSDYCGGWVRSLRYRNGRAEDVRDWTEPLGRPGSISSFGEDASGELYVMTHAGTLYRFAPR